MMGQLNHSQIQWYLIRLKNQNLFYIQTIIQTRPFTLLFKKYMQSIQKDSPLENTHQTPEVENLPPLAEIEPALSVESDAPKEYKEEWYRWVIIFLVSVAFAINNLANNAIIPISSKVAKLYDLSETYANLPIQITFLITPIMNFTAGNFIDSKGIGISFRIGAVMYAIGLLLFCLINFGYHWVLIGAIILSLAQPLVMNCPAKIATYWFIDKNRTVATGIISAINLVTLGASLVVPTISVKEDAEGDEAKDQIFGLYSKYFIVSVVNCLLIIFLMRQKPVNLPSAGAQQQKTTLTKTWQIIKSDRNVWRFLAAAVLLYGTFLSFGSTSNMLFKSYNFQDVQIAIFGVCLLVSGVAGSVVYTIYIKKTIKYKNAIVCATTLAVIFMITNGILMNVVPEQKILLSFLILGMGFNLVPMVPVSYDLGCELTFPVGEAQVVGIITGISMLYTVVLTLTISSAVGFGTAKQSGICMIVYIILFIIGSVLYCTVDIKLKRRDHQQKALEGRKSVDGNYYEVNLTMNDSAKEAHMGLTLNGKKISESEQMIVVVAEDMIINNEVKGSVIGEEFDTGESSPEKFSEKSKRNLSEKLLGNKNNKFDNTKRKTSRFNNNSKDKETNQEGEKQQEQFQQ